ncbi:MAG TPA: TetR/AcrR family transcriptional regulator, partial [Actinopolymorphaceae bacterium]
MSVGRAARRDATLTAIKQAARDLVRSEGPDGIGLRAVARRLDLTAPALYRYVASHQDLIDLVVADVYDELCAVLEDAVARAPEDPGVQLEAASRAFRRWALAHRPEFGLVFAHPIPPEESPRTVDAGKARFARVFGRLFAELWRTRPFPVPTTLRPDVARQVEARASAYVPGLPVGAA